MLSERVGRARKASAFAGVLTRDKEEKIRTLVVPGSCGRRYHEIVRRNGTSISVECRLEVGRGYLDCQGNSHSVCYHAVATAIKVAAEAGYKVSLCDDPKKAERVRRLHNGKIGQLKSHQSGKALWIVYYKEGKQNGR